MIHITPYYFYDRLLTYHFADFLEDRLEKVFEFHVIGRPALWDRGIAHLTNN